MGTENDFCGTKIHAPERSCHLGTWSQDCKYLLILGQKYQDFDLKKILGQSTKIAKIKNLGTRYQDF